MAQIVPAPAQSGAPKDAECDMGGKGRNLDAVFPPLRHQVAHFRFNRGIGAVRDGGFHIFGQCAAGGHQHGGSAHGHAMEQNLRLRVPADYPGNPAHQV